jgi:hypothetical protein
LATTTKSTKITNSAKFTTSIPLQSKIATANRSCPYFSFAPGPAEVQFDDPNDFDFHNHHDDFEFDQGDGHDVVGRHDDVFGRHDSNRNNNNNSNPLPVDQPPPSPSPIFSSNISTGGRQVVQPAPGEALNAHFGTALEKFNLKKPPQATLPFSTTYNANLPPGGQPCDFFRLGGGLDSGTQDVLAEAEQKQLAQLQQPQHKTGQKMVKSQGASITSSQRLVTSTAIMSLCLRRCGG